jgi:D-alanyl-D-alanine carboxypeptidase (penicillin-binding protein 5/6)
VADATHVGLSLVAALSQAILGVSRRVFGAAAVMALAVSSGIAATATGKSDFQTTAPHAILVEAESGSVLFEKNSDSLMYPASLAKLMTAEYVFNEIRQGRLKLDDEFHVSENAWRRGGAPSGGSAMFAALNSRVRVEDLLRGVIIQSGNDACIVLAEGIAGIEAEFAGRLTRRARELGLVKSTFMNSTGLHDPGQQVTARELALLARHIIATYPEFYPIYAERDFLWNKIRQQNRNPLLAMGIGADGLKTGFTKEAGYGLVGSAVQNGLRLIVVVNGTKSAKERADEARKLLDWGFRNFESRLLFAEGQHIGEAKLFGGEKARVPLIGSGAIRIMVPRGTSEKLIARVVYTGPVAAPVKEGQPIGKLRVWRNDSLALEVPLKAAESVEQGNLTQRAFDAASELVIGVFRAGADRL